MSNELSGFASLPADTFAEGPNSGGDGGDGTPISANGRTGPFAGQPVQGFSGVQFAPSGNGAFWFLSDNGFGAQENSTDYLLRLYQVDPNFTGAENGDGSVEIEGFVQLSDPDNLIPFDIINEDTEERQLTGGDFDIESFVLDSNGDIWIGEEFGPYILHFDAEGKLLEAPIATPNITNLSTLEGQDPLVIGHRGASGTLPEHTLEAYQLAIDQGADFIEPDLVVTSDGVLIARHEPTLAQVELDDAGNIRFDDNGQPILKAGTANTTNVSELPEFADRLTVKSLDGTLVGGWYAEDFTLEEIKQLTAVQSRDYRDQSFNDDGFQIPTFEEVIALANENGVGIYPETKHPTYFLHEGTYIGGEPINVDTSQLLIDTLVANNFTDPDQIFIQSFELENLIRLQNEIMPAVGIDLPLVQLTDNFTTSVYDVAFNFRPGNSAANPEIYDGIPIELQENTVYGDILNADFITWIADNYAEGLGPWKETFRLTERLDEPVDGNGDGVAEITKRITGEVLPVVDWAHDVGLQVHTYTMRDEERHLYLVDGEPESAEEEYRQLINLGVDGFFTDFPATGVSVVNSVTGEFVQSPQNSDLGDALPNLARSRGYEGMAFSPDRQTLYPLLEGVVDGDPENALRIYEYDVATSSFEGLVGYYPTDDGHPIGDFTPISDREFLVIERDGGQGETAEFKKIFKINFDNIDENGFVEKTEVVDLLNIDDPNDLNGDGNTTYDMPFVTIEDVVVIDSSTILVANDNNYPFSQGRADDIDNNEIALIRLDEPLNLDSNLGGEVLTPILDGI